MTEDKPLEVDAGEKAQCREQLPGEEWKKNWLRLAAQLQKEHALVRSEGCGDERV